MTTTSPPRLIVVDPTVIMRRPNDTAVSAAQAASDFRQVLAHLQLEVPSYSGRGSASGDQLKPSHQFNGSRWLSHLHHTLQASSLDTIRDLPSDSFVGHSGHHNNGFLDAVLRLMA